MRRRELLAGLLGGGAVIGGGAVAVTGIPSLGDDDVPEPNESVEVTALEARGSEPGPTTIPFDEGLTVLTFFATTCPSCEDKMPNLVEARERLSEEPVRFASATVEYVGDGVPESEVVEWFESRDGDWTLAHDPASELTVTYDGIPYPKTAAIDPDGRIWWEHTGYMSADDLVAEIDGALEDAFEYTDV